jgi:ATP-dependent Clp protease ATP-binding subunit ClpB
MPPFEKLTTKAKNALQRSHELAMERGQDHVEVAHLLTALVLQDESPVVSVLEKLEIDLIQLTERLLEEIETGESASGTNQSQMIQMFIAPDLAQVLERSVQIAAGLKDEYISVEHLFLGVLALPHAMRPKLDQMHITYDRVSKH